MGRSRPLFNSEYKIRVIYVFANATTGTSVDPGADEEDDLLMRQRAGVAAPTDKTEGTVDLMSKYLAPADDSFAEEWQVWHGCVDSSFVNRYWLTPIFAFYIFLE